MTRHGTAGFHRVRRSHFFRPAAFSARRCRHRGRRRRPAAVVAHRAAPACPPHAGRGRTVRRACRCRRSRAAARRPAPGAGDMEAGAIGVNRQLFHQAGFLSLRRATASEFCAHAACLASRPRLELGATAAVRSARIALRRGGRVVECTALEMRHRCKPIGGSNPSLSASKSLKLNEKIYSPELRRYFRRLATAVAGVGH